MTTRTLDTGADQLLCALAGIVATITLNLPDKRDALSDELTQKSFKVSNSGGPFRPAIGLPATG
jgi:hypothetical protein